MDINSINLSGNLTADPEPFGRKDSDGEVVNVLGTKLRLASDYRTKVNDEWVKQTNYVNIVVWGSLGKLVRETQTKGNKLAITGRLRYNEWRTTDDQRRETVEVHADDVVFLSPKEELDF